MFDLLTVFIIVLALFIFYQYLYKRRHGFWVDQIPFEVDESLIWKVKYLSFGIFNPSSVEVPPDSRMFCIFRGAQMLDVYDQRMRHIKHYYNPQVLVFDEGIDLFHGIKYHFLLTYCNDEELEATTFIDIPQDDKPLNEVESIYEIVPKEYYNENFYRTECTKFMARIVQEMEENDYALECIEDSELRRSFPHNMLINELEIDLSGGKVVVVMVTNKRKIFSLDDHSIEFESEQKSFVWNPSGDDNFSFLILDENTGEAEDEDEDGIEILIREYLYCEESQLLPIRALTFY